MDTYTLAESTAGTDEETSTNGTTNGNHVQVTRLHGLVEDGETASLTRAALERLEVQTIACHEVLLLAPLGLSMALRGLDGGVGHARLLVGGEHLFVIHVDSVVKEGGGRDSRQKKVQPGERGRGLIVK